MKTSESVIQIAPALLKAQKSLQVAIKDASNPHFNSKFADLTSIIEVAQPALNDSDIVFLQPVSFHESRVVVTTVLMHSSGEWISDALEIPLTNKQDAQAVGSCISYGRRYGLQAFVGIRAEDDDGNKGSEYKPPQETRRAPSVVTQQLKASLNPEAEDPDDIDAYLSDRPPVYDFESPAPVTPIRKVPTGPVISEAQSKRFFGIAMGSGKSKPEINHYLASRGYAATSDIRKSEYEELCAWAGAK